MTTSPVDAVGRREPSGQADPVTTLRQFLTYQRDTLEWKCRGLDDASLRRGLAPTSLTLAGLLAHMATVEDYWFSTILAEAPFPGQHYPGGEPGPTWEWDEGAQLPADELRRLWRESVARSDAVLERVLARPDALEATFARGDGRLNAAWVLTHMVEEYARHNGHADLLRESIDGETGE